MRNDEDIFYNDVLNGNIVLEEIPCGEIEISQDEAIRLQGCGISIKSDMEVVADLESGLRTLD